MQNKESFGQALEQSQEQFRKQFDPTHPLYHGGLQVVVPTGGDRIPQSMPTMYPQGFNPNQSQETVDYGEQYKTVQANRAVYQNLKKQLARLGPIVEAFLRHEQAYKLKGDPNNQKHKQVHQQNLAKQQQNLKIVQDVLSSFIPTLEAMDGQGKECAKQLTDVIYESGKKHQNKETLTDFNFRMKKLSAKTFAIAQKCLQKLKDIKKQYANKQKQGQTKIEQ